MKTTIGQFEAPREPAFLHEETELVENGVRRRTAMCRNGDSLPAQTFTTLVNST
jgi:hypothetical protein